LARTLVAARTWPFLIDSCVAACGLAIFFSIISTGAYWLSRPVPVVEISHSIGALPAYAFYSIVRMGIAYLLSLLFAVAYGYTAAYNPRVEAWMIAVLDILQSIPVFSFLPPVVLAMVALVPRHQLGIEMAVILLIFTGQVWNLAFSFYASLKSIPMEMVEASRIYRFSAWQRFWQLEMPYAAIGLVWNSIVSVAGGWFALMLCETFTMGVRNFQLPGLGSYIQSATNSGDVRALLSGIAVVILIVVATDQLVWRPLIAWSDKFKFEQVESADRVTSPILELLRRSSLLTSIPGRVLAHIEEPIYRRMAHTKECRVVQPLDEGQLRRKASPALWALAGAAICIVGWGATQAILLLRTVTWPDLRLLLEGTAASLRFLPRPAHRPGPDRRWPGHRLHCPHAPRHAVVHPLQRHRRSHVHPLRPARGLLALPLQPLAALDQTHSPWNLPLPHHRHGHGLRRSLERLRDGRILPRKGPDA
jgi:NitT/TauT family transport system permease protein